MTNTNNLIYYKKIYFWKVSDKDSFMKWSMDFCHIKMRAQAVGNFFKNSNRSMIDELKNNMLRTLPVPIISLRNKIFCLGSGNFHWFWTPLTGWGDWVSVGQNILNFSL